MAIAVAKHTVALADAVKKAEDQFNCQLREAEARTATLTETAARAAAQTATAHTLQEAAREGGLSRAAIRTASAPLVESAWAEGEAAAEARARAREAAAATAAREDRERAVEEVTRKSEAAVRACEMRAEEKIAQAESMTAQVCPSFTPYAHLTS